MQAVTITQITAPELETLIENSIKKVLSTQQAKQPETDKLLTIQEAAEFLRLTVPTIYGKVHRNELPYMKRGKRVYFSSRELMEYLKAGRVKSNAEIEQEADQYCKTKKG
jgi:excisionase family DNA binding protein